MLSGIIRVERDLCSFWVQALLKAGLTILSVKYSLELYFRGTFLDIVS